MAGINNTNSGGETEIYGIDEKLAGAAQQQIREAVRVLPEETLSMAWRSGLNEQIAAMAANKKRRVAFDWVWKPALGAALACSFAFVVMWKTHPTQAPASMVSNSSSASIETALLDAHQESSVAADVAGPGLVTRDAQVVRSVNYSRDESWPEVDVNSL
jgi:hypothetical protein